MAMMVGVVLVVGGVGQLVFAMKTGKSILAFILGLLTLVIGAHMVTHPGAALASLTIFLAAYLVVSGIFEVFMASQVRPAKGWVWMLFSGIISLMLGMMIWNQFPLSGAWAVGIILGVRLFFSGWTLIMFGLAARSFSREI